MQLNRFIRILKSRCSTLVATAIGLVFGTAFAGPWNILPWNTSWLNGKGDGSTDQLVFQFFRQTPFLQWPMTAVSNFAVGANTVNPSGNTIFTVGAKFIGLIVPGQFQYFGILIVLWFALQALFAERLLSRFISDGTFRIIGAIFFVIAPAFLYRLSAMRHFHVGAHWLILAALYLYFDDRSRTKAWAILIAIAIAINLYISVSVVVVFIASVVKLYMRNDFLSFWSKLKSCIMYAVPSILAAWGSFVLSGFLSYKGSSSGAGFYRLNLFAYFNPVYSSTESFSNFLNVFVPISRRIIFAEEWEGFQYLGLGVSFCLPLVAVYSWRNRRKFRNSSWLPLTLSLGLLFLIALSNQVTFAHIEIHYWWPDALLHFRQIFRGASRFGFALYYLLTFASILSITVLNISRSSRADGLFIGHP